MHIERLQTQKYEGLGKVRLELLLILRGRAEVARQAHNLEVVGSNPTPATRGRVSSILEPRTQRKSVDSVTMYMIALF